MESTGAAAIADDSGATIDPAPPVAAAAVVVAAGFAAAGFAAAGAVAAGFAAVGFAAEREVVAGFAATGFAAGVEPETPGTGLSAEPSGAEGGGGTADRATETPLSGVCDRAERLLNRCPQASERCLVQPVNSRRVERNTPQNTNHATVPTQPMMIAARAMPRPG